MSNYFKSQQIDILALQCYRATRIFTFISFIFSTLPKKLLPDLMRNLVSNVIFLASLLLYSFGSQALTFYSANAIQGSEPYFTVDGGQTKITSSDGLLGIRLSDGTIITPSTNDSTTANPIVLPKSGERFTDISMFVPLSKNSSELNIPLNTLVTEPYNYWGDDDGDGQVSATGEISVKITDKNNRAVNRSEVLTICHAPYKVVLSNTDSTLKTKYGTPDHIMVSAATTSYYINPKDSPAVCYARAGFMYGGRGPVADEFHRGPANIWDPDRGFLTQTATPESYARNFPTTGGDNVYFYLEIGGIDEKELTWSSVTKEGITATIELVPPDDRAYSEFDRKGGTRVTLKGPTVKWDDMISFPNRIYKPNLPQTFELVGEDNHGNKVKYGFVLQKWFVARGSLPHYGEKAPIDTWCSRLGDYRAVKIEDLTNAKCGVIDINNLPYGHFPCIDGVDGAMPFSNGNYYQRQIGAGFFTEWGNYSNYPMSQFSANAHYIGYSKNKDYMFLIYGESGIVNAMENYGEDISYNPGLCVTP